MKGDQQPQVSSEIARHDVSSRVAIDPFMARVWWVSVSFTAAAVPSALLGMTIHTATEGLISSTVSGIIAFVLVGPALRITMGVDIGGIRVVNKWKSFSASWADIEDVVPRTPIWEPPGGSPIVSLRLRDTRRWQLLMATSHLHDEAAKSRVVNELQQAVRNSRNRMPNQLGVDWETGTSQGSSFSSCRLWVADSPSVLELALLLLSVVAFAAGIANVAQGYILSAVILVPTSYVLVGFVALARRMSRTFVYAPVY